MAGSVNKVILVGNLGRDPESRTTQAGGTVVTLSVATSESWKDRNTGERRERTEWHRVVIFNEALCTVAQNYLRKGSKVYLEGQLQTRKWTDNGGVERYSTEVVLSQFRSQLTLLDRRDRDPGADGPEAYGTPSPHPEPVEGRRPQAGDGRPGVDGDLDDEIPF